MKYRMIVSDFDGTLARSDDTISPATKEAIADYIEAGGLFSICTGRILSTIKPRLEEAGLCGVSFPLMSHQGALVVDSVTNETLLATSIDMGLVRRLCRYFEERGDYYHLYTKDNLLIKEPVRFSKIYCDHVKAHDIAMYVGTLSEYINTLAPDAVLKVSFMCSPKKTDELAALANEYFKGEVNFVSAAEGLVEATGKDSGKGNAILRVGAMRGIDRSEIAAIGDSMNDYSMIEAAGLGVAVENATEALRNRASLIVASNDRDGVAELLRKAINDELD